MGAARDSMRNAWDDWASGRLETTADDGRGSFYVLDGTELRREVERRERSYQEHIDAMTSKHEAEMRELRRTPGMALALGAAAAALTWLVLNVLRP